MPNMSYCRFENTNGDLRDCYEALRNFSNDPDNDDYISDRELDQAIRLIEQCQSIVDEFDLYELQDMLNARKAKQSYNS